MSDSPRRGSAEEQGLGPECEGGSGSVQRSGDDSPFERLCEQARSAWPEIGLERETFAQHLMSLIEGTAATSEGIADVTVQDLFLAYACAQGDKKALAAFARDFEPDLRAVGKKLRVSDGDLDDIRQKLWDKLFLDGGGHPKKILEFRGIGRLRNWFRVLVARVILDELRREKRSEIHRQVVENTALWIAAPDADPELANIRNKYRETFRFAFESAARALEPAERNFLRCHYLMGMTMEQIAESFGFHKATAARQVARARSKLLELTRGGVQAQLGANSGELESVMRLFNEEISLSFSRLLS